MALSPHDFLVGPGTFFQRDTEYKRHLLGQWCIAWYYTGFCQGCRVTRVPYQVTIGSAGPAAVITLLLSGAWLNAQGSSHELRSIFVVSPKDMDHIYGP